MAYKNKSYKRNYRRKKLSGFYMLLIAAIVMLSVLFGCIIFFKITTIDIKIKDSDTEYSDVETSMKYTEDEILNTASIKTGDNLFLLDKDKTAAKILDNLPYISSVNIQKNFPNTLSIIITECDAACAIADSDSDSTWWYINADGKILENNENPTIAQVSGIKLKDAVINNNFSNYIDDAENESIKQDSLLKLLSPLQDYGLLANVKAFAITESDITFDYNGKIQVKIPLESDFDYKIKYFNRILSDYIAVNWNENDTGVLDMTYSDGHPHLTKNN